MSNELAERIAREIAIYLPFQGQGRSGEKVLADVIGRIDRHFPAAQWQGIESRGVGLIANERARQVTEEGWTPEHDAEHKQGELAQAAACYAWPPPRPIEVKKAWPWNWQWWKPTIPASGANSNKEEWRDARVRDLVKAGALIAAEIDRLIPSPSEAAQPVAPTVVPAEEARPLQIEPLGELSDDQLSNIERDLPTASQTKLRVLLRGMIGHYRVTPRRYPRRRTAGQ